MGFLNIVNAQPTKPWGLKWRSSVWFITLVVGFGITTDLLVYSIIIPVMPFQLERLGYQGVSALTGWLLCAYSLGLVLSTIPIAMFSEKNSSRRSPLVLGLLALLGAQVLLMEAPNYALMAVARVLQGVSSSMVWIVGLALLCDSTPEQNVGRQLGIAMTGLSVGLMVGTPAGGTLYAKFGFRAPFIFGEICTAVDLLLRFLIIERDVAIRWGYDPATGQEVNFIRDLGDFPPLHPSSDPVSPSAEHLAPEHAARHFPPPHPSSDPVSPSAEHLAPEHAARHFPPPHPSSDPVSPSAEHLTPEHAAREDTPVFNHPNPTHSDSHLARTDSRVSTNPNMVTMSELSLVRKPLPMLTVMRQLGMSPRAVTALTMSLIYGTVNSMQEPSLPLHLQSVWGYNSDKVGLVYMAGLVPALISSPLAGLLADRVGSDFLATGCLLLTFPWWIVLALRQSIALFVLALALQSFFVSGVVPPVTAELASVSRAMPGVGYAHVYGAFNLAFGIGTAVGPIIGGQVYGHARHGWTALCCITVGLILICSILAFCFTGPDPLLSKLMRQHNMSQFSLELKPLKKGTKGHAVSTHSPSAV